MRVFGLFLSVLALATIVGGAIAIATDFPGGNGRASGVQATPTMNAGDAQGTQASGGESTSGTVSGANGTEQVDGDGAQTATTDQASDVRASPTPPLFEADIVVQEPRLELPTEPLMTVEATYTEIHRFGQVKVAFRPGAYSIEHATDVAAMTSAALIEANEKLGTAWDQDLTVFLVDQLFAEDCLGCQGFTESDFRWIFMLDDGSVVRDEFEALLVHEMTHLIAGNEIHLPFEIFYVEGLAMWVMTDDLVNAGYASPLQTTAWVYRAGQLPALQDLIADDFAGRMRKRIYYDAAGAFAFFVIERYGYEQYLALYQQQPMEFVLGKPEQEIEVEFHAFLDQFGDNSLAGADAVSWWDAASQVIAAFGRFYDDPEALTAEQYRLLTLSRLALNRAEVHSALHYLAQSGV